MGREREKWVDIVRGFAIYLVVLGHCIQYATPSDYMFKENIVFRIIYGFHMPLFMIVSGYLFWNTLQRYNLMDGIKAKLKGILIPCLSWGMVTYLCELITFGNTSISLMGAARYIYYSNWFLWAVFYCSLYGFLTKYVLNNKIWGYGVLLLINYLIHDIGNYAGTKRMLPFFLMGMLLHRYYLLEKVNEKNEIGLLLLSGACYLFSLKMQCIELVTGTIGSIFVILFFGKLLKKRKMKVLQVLGQVSISIYLLTGILFWFWIKEYFRISSSYRYAVKAAYILLLSLGMTVVSFGVSKLIQKNKIVSRLFLGR